MYLRADVFDSGIGQVQRLNYLGDIQMKIDQGWHRRSPDFLVEGVVATR